MAIHVTLAAGRWGTFSFEEQMGNIGSEVGRALNAYANGDKARWEAAYIRAMELFDFTEKDARWSNRLHEVVHARDVVRDYFYGDNQYHSEPKKIDAYFMDFAMAARLKR